MSEVYGTGEFTLADKIEDPGHLEGRVRALRRLYRRDPRLAAEVVSYAWPHPAERPWTPEELRERLALRGAVKAAALYLKEAAPEFLARTLPSAAAAVDAFAAERARQEALDAQAAAIRYPALGFTQPQMASYALGGGGAFGNWTGGAASSPAPTHHHHRRHHHHG